MGELIHSVESRVVTPKRLYLSIRGWSSALTGCKPFGCVGCLSGILSLIVVLLLPALWPEIGLGIDWRTEFLLVLVSAVAAFLVVSFVEYLRQATNTANAAAKQATATARYRYNDLRYQTSVMQYEAYQAAAALSQALTEFREHRYARFWDAIEATALAVDRFRAAQNALAADITDYVTTLHGAEHDFPPWYDGVDAIADVDAIVPEMNRLRLAAEADFHFANIWEHRQSRKVLIAGFDTLGEGIRHLEESVIKSLDSLKAAVQKSVSLQGQPTSVTSFSVVAKFLIPLP